MAVEEAGDTGSSSLDVQQVEAHPVSGQAAAWVAVLARLMTALGDELAAVHVGFGSNARLDRICDER